MRDDGMAREYDALAAHYDANRGAFDISAILTAFASELPVRGHLTDLGCGAGVPVAREFVTRGWSVVGVDVSAQMLRLANQHVPEMTTIQSDMRTVERPPASQDAVTAVYSLFHVPWRDHPAIFRDVHRWLVPGGRFLFTYATQDYTGEAEFDGYRDFQNHQLYYSHTTPDQLRHQLTDAQLQVHDWQVRSVGGEDFLWVIAGKIR